MLFSIVLPLKVNRLSGSALKPIVNVSSLFSVFNVSTYPLAKLIPSGASADVLLSVDSVLVEVPPL